MNKQPHPNKTIQMMLAKDLLRPLVPAVAAEKPSIMQAKLDKNRMIQQPSQEPAAEPEPNYKGYYGSGPEDNDDDDDYLKQYRNRRL